METDKFIYDNTKQFQEKQDIKKLIIDIENKYKEQKAKESLEYGIIKKNYKFSEMNEENFNFNNFKNGLILSVNNVNKNI